MRPTDQRGFSLIEALTATVIAIIAVLGLAFTFSVGRGQVGRYAVARAAQGVVASRMERLLDLLERSPGVDSLAIGYVSPLFPFSYMGANVGTVSWHIDPFDDPYIPGTQDLRRIVVCVRWNSGLPDSLQLDQLVQP